MFYKNQALLELGHVVTPGNWGRKILGVGPTHGAFYREQVFETIRAPEFSAGPSRMVVAFALEDETFATHWARGGMREIVYRVRAADLNAVACALDMGWFEELLVRHSFAAV